MTAPFETFRYLPELLTSRGYDKALMDSILYASETTPQTPIEMRLLLERFFRAAAEKEKGVRFDGDPQSFSALTQFARSRQWLTEPERRFIGALYALLSDTAAHPGQSLVDPTIARNNVLYAIWLVLHRFHTRAGRPVAGFGGSAGRLQLADQFLRGIRNGMHAGPGFEVEFDQDLMQLTRQRLRYGDVRPLMSFITNENASPRLRHRCASLVLSPRCYRRPEESASVVAELDRYCRERFDTMPWQLARAIALALANRANHADRLLDFLDKISGSQDALEQNLRESDRYYGDSPNAITYYKSRLQNMDIPPSGCIWEVFYVIRRCDAAQKNTFRRLLERRLGQIDTPRIRAFWVDAIGSLAER